MRWNTETVLSALSVAIAVIALGVSIKSCRQSERSVSIAEEEFASARSAVWTLEVSGDSLARLTSVSDEIQLQKAFLYFPPNFGIAALPVRSPNYQLSASLAERAIQIGINQIGRSRTKKRILGPVASVPVAIESWYAVRGKSFRDVAIYSLEFHPRALSDSVDVDVSGLSFARRLNSDDNVRNVLMDEWKKYLAP